MAVTYIVAVFHGLHGHANAQGISPMGWYTFDSIPPELDLSGNGAHLNVSGFPLLLNSSGGIVGNYLDQNAYGSGDHLPCADYTAGTLDSLNADDTEFSYEFVFKTGEKFNITTLASFFGRGSMSLTDRALTAQIVFFDGTRETLSIPLSGVGRRDPTYYTDGNWHHMAFTFSAKSGEMKIYVDGVSPPGFSKELGPAKCLHPVNKYCPGSQFSPSDYAGGSWFEGCMDEIAFYRDLLTPGMVYQHYTEVMSGSRYTFPVVGITPPEVPGPVTDGERNPLEFGPGYPSVTLPSLALLKTYPGARYKPNHQMKQIIPWIADYDRLALDGATVDVSGPVAAEIQKELIDHYNYGLQVGGLAQARPGIPFPLGHPRNLMTHFINLANTPPYSDPSIDRVLITNWGQIRPSDAGYPAATIGTSTDRPYVRRYFGDLPLDHFVYNSGTSAIFSDGTQSPDAPLDSLTFDGLTARSYINNIFTASTSLIRDEIDIITENGEVLRSYPAGVLATDVSVVADFTPFGISWNGYQSMRMRQKRQHYADQFQAFAGATEVQWYNVGGNVSNIFQYDSAAAINTWLDSLRRPSPYFYPQTPGRWRYHYGPLNGVNRITKGRIIEIAAGDSIFNPFVSPGFSDGGNTYNIEDQNIIRPGQYLGLLKNLAMLGADTYTNFMYWGTDPPGPDPVYESNWRIWKTVIPSYAQAITSRYPEFMYNGEVLEGNPRAVSDGSGSGLGATYSFNTGNLLDYVTIRKLYGEDKYLIVGSAEKSGTSTANGDLRRNVGIFLDGDSIFFPIRLQGSSYIYDNTKILDPVFYQVDKWHEWKEPYYWCKDFCFEGEVYDSIRFNSLAPYFAGPLTETPGPLTDRDFTDFTSYIRWGISGLPPAPPPPAGSADEEPGDIRYRFLVRDASQTTLHFWVRARRRIGSPANEDFTKCDVEIDGLGGSLATLDTITSTSWQWYRLNTGGTPIQFTGLGIGNEYDLVLTPDNIFLEIDQIILKTGSDDINSFTLTAGFDGDTVCFGDTIAFNNTSSLGSGCIDYFWEFGDGRQSYEANPKHYYQYPGTYEVQLIVMEHCSNQSDTTGQTIVVYAPTADAGIDSIKCGADTVSLAGSATGTYYWHSTPHLSDTTILGPMAFNDTTTKFFLTASEIFTFGGGTHTCSLTDSVQVFVADAKLVAADTLIRICPGDTAFMSVDGACQFWWETTGEAVSNDTISDPYATPDTTTIYLAIGVDACRCDTDTVAITVEVLVPYGDILTPDTTICGSDTIQLLTNITDPGTVIWSPTPLYNMSLPPGDNPFVSPDTAYTYYAELIDTNGCRVEDMVTISTKSPWLYITTPDTSWCENETFQLEANGGISWDWSPGTELDDSTIINPTTVPYRDPELYSVLITDTAGCVWYDEATVAYDTSCCVLDSADFDFMIEVDSISNIRAALGLTPGATILGQTFHVLDTLFIDEDAFATSCNFRMNAHSVIMIHPGITFTSTQNSYESACGDEMWEEIRIPDSSSAFISAGDKIKDGYTAIHSLRGGDYQIQNATFRRNQYSVWVDPFSGIHPGWLHTCTFRSGSYLLPPNTTGVAEAGVILNGVDSVNVGDPAVSGFRNEFSELITGVRARFSNFGVYNNVFGNMVEQFGFDGNVVDGTGAAISATGFFGATAPHYRMTVGLDSLVSPFGDNTVKRCYDGVHVLQNYNTKIEYNKFRVMRGRAIHMQTNYFADCEINNNKIVETPIGISLTTTAGSRFRIYSNKIIDNSTTSRRGIQILDISSSGTPSSGYESTDYDIDNNILNLAGDGIWASGARHLRIRNNTLKIGRPSTGSFNYGIRIQGCDSARVLENIVRSTTVPPDTMMRGMYTQLSTDGLYSCNRVKLFGEEMTFEGSCLGTELWENKIGVVDSSLPYSSVYGLVLRNGGIIERQGTLTLPSSNKWRGVFQKWQTLSSNSDGSDSELFVRNTTTQYPTSNGLEGPGAISFTVNNGASGSLGFACTDEPIGPGGGGSTTLASPRMIDIAADTASYVILPTELGFFEKRYLQGKLASDPALLASDTVFSSFMATVSGTDVEHLPTIDERFSANDLGGALALNSTLSIGHQYCVNHKFCNGVIAACLDSIESEIDPGTLLILKAIADECPLVGGPAVYHARALVEMVEPGRAYEDLCEDIFQGQPQAPEAGFDSAQPDKQERVTVYPNPARGTAFFKGIGSEVTIRVFDLLGNEEISFILDKQSTHEVNISDWVQGVHYYTVEKEGQIIQSGKVVVF